ncbi:hypothetical protein GCM10022225_34280 [Plantactinospora mayteni]|uniref:Uncharacterized protein n=1 Tax=Plantactinospora mayteni TaxID=566021 RepID=A0ABQ4EMT3_9ACTN|nr:hypothetical protein [Plantactinospora mayteni]GIG95963.1 hypothetical protein Pma05_25360 [Plantactinospora mayteni]
MRHLWSFLAGVVAAPLTWALIALGQDGSARTVTRWVEVGTFNTANLIQGAVYLGVAGILLGLLGTLRLSPAGPLVAGLLLVAPYAGLFVDPFTVRDAVPANWKLFGDPLLLVQALDNGTTFLIGVLLLMATFSIQRWRRWPRPVAAGPAPTSSDVEEPTPTDWSLLNNPPEADIKPPTLGYPEPDTEPLPPLPRRDAGSPWSAPPRSATTRDDAADSTTS